MSEWSAVGDKLRTANRKPMRQVADTHERCDGCGLNVTRGTTRMVVRPDASPAGTDVRGQPYYRLEDWHALCSRCRR